jgi:hypothetical protein
MSHCTVIEALWQGAFTLASFRLMTSRSRTATGANSASLEKGIERSSVDVPPSAEHVARLLARQRALFQVRKYLDCIPQLRVAAAPERQRDEGEGGGGRKGGRKAGRGPTQLTRQRRQRAQEAESARTAITSCLYSDRLLP